jgi:hypothetical protein
MREHRTPSEDRVKVGRAALLSLMLLVSGATPASASPVPGAEGAPVVMAAAKPWHYWLAPVLLLSFLGLLGLLALGYVVRVLMAKYGIRVGRRG